MRFNDYWKKDVSGFDDYYNDFFENDVDNVPDLICVQRDDCRIAVLCKAHDWDYSELYWDWYWNPTDYHLKTENRA